MRQLLALPLLLVATPILAQNDAIYNGAGTFLGNRSEFMQECMKEMGSDKELALFGGEKVCDCMLTMMLSIPEVDRSKSEAALDELDFDALMERDTVLVAGLQECVLASIQNDVPIRTLGSDALKAMIDDCIVRSDGSPELAQAGVDADILCTCVFDEVYRRNFTMMQVLRLEDPNSVEFNELMLPCLERAQGDRREGVPRYAGSPDVTGPKLTDQVPMLAMGKLHKVKVTMYGMERYWIIDSGASDPIVTSAFAEELRKGEVLTEKMRLPSHDYTLADGRTVTCERFMVQNVKIGEFTVANVVLAVLPADSESQFLLGKSFLDKFTEWRLDSRTSTLYLKRG